MPLARFLLTAHPLNPSFQARAVIDEGRHINASRPFVVACGRRLIGAGRYMLSRSSERRLLGVGALQAPGRA